MPQSEPPYLAMTLSIHRVTSHSEEHPAGYIHLRLQDAASRIIAADVEMGIEEFARALFGEGCIPCLVRLNRASDRIGKQRETKRERVPLSKDLCSSEAGAEASVRLAVRPYEIDGWRVMRWEDAFNGHFRRWVNGEPYAELIFERWVDG